MTSVDSSGLHQRIRDTNGISLCDEWLEQCIQHINSRGKLSADPKYACEQIFEKLLYANLSDICEGDSGCLPANLTELNGTFLAGPYLLQVVERVNVGQCQQQASNPADTAGQSAPAPTSSGLNGTSASRNRLLKLFLTDGFQEVVALELEHIPALTAVLPGGKILLRGCMAQHGALLLTHQSHGPGTGSDPCTCVGVLGGAVEELLAAAESKTARVAGDPAAGAHAPGASIGTGRTAAAAVPAQQGFHEHALVQATLPPAVSRPQTAAVPTVAAATTAVRKTTRGHVADNSDYADEQWMMEEDARSDREEEWPEEEWEQAKAKHTVPLMTKEITLPQPHSPMVVELVSEVNTPEPLPPRPTASAFKISIGGAICLDDSPVPPMPGPMAPAQTDTFSYHYTLGTQSLEPEGLQQPGGALRSEPRAQETVSAMEWDGGDMPLSPLPLPETAMEPERPEEPWPRVGSPSYDVTEDTPLPPPPVPMPALAPVPTTVAVPLLAVSPESVDLAGGPLARFRITGRALSLYRFKCLPRPGTKVRDFHVHIVFEEEAGPSQPAQLASALVQARLGMSPAEFHKEHLRLTKVSKEEAKRFKEHLGRKFEGFQGTFLAERITTIGGGDIPSPGSGVSASTAGPNSPNSTSNSTTMSVGRGEPTVILLEEVLCQ